MSRSSIRIGTSGFDYKDWYGPFFPPSLKPQHRLEYYAQRFKTLELNITFYQLLSRSRRWLDQQSRDRVSFHS
jgi:uncharacterized protein YecE (DUF72 family)